MFLGLDLRNLSSKLPRKKYTPSFYTIETYPKIPRLSVEACPQKKPQVVEALLNVTFTVQTSISAACRIDATSFTLQYCITIEFHCIVNSIIETFMFTDVTDFACQRPRSRGELGPRKASRMLFQTCVLGTQAMSLRRLKSFKFLAVLFAIGGLVFTNLLKKPTSRVNISVQKKRELSVIGCSTEVISRVLSTSGHSSEKLKGSLVYDPQNNGTKNFSNDTLISYDLGNLPDLIQREPSALTEQQLASILCNFKQSWIRKEYIGKMCIIWMKRDVKEVEAVECKPSNISFLATEDLSTSFVAQTWNLSQLSSVSVPMEAMLNRASYFQAKSFILNGLRLTMISGKYYFNFPFGLSND